MQEMLEVATAIRKVARVLWSMHTLFQEARALLLTCSSRAVSGTSVSAHVFETLFTAVVSPNQGHRRLCCGSSSCRALTSRPCRCCCSSIHRTSWASYERRPTAPSRQGPAVACQRLIIDCTAS